MPSSAGPPVFLAGCGPMAELIASFDWRSTGLPALEQWPSHMRQATALMLRCQVPIAMLWGERGVMVYNDAYAPFAGARHPGLLGSEVRSGWAEVAEFNDKVMKVGLAGGTLSYSDQELTGHHPLIGRTVAQALPEAAEQGYVQLLDEVYRSGEAVSVHGVKYVLPALPGAPGRVFYLDAVLQPIRAASGAVAGIFIDGVDVSDRTASERRREALAHLSESLNGIDIPAEIGYLAAQTLGELLDTSRVGYGTIDDVADTLHVERDWTAPGVESLSGSTPLRHFGSFVDSLKRDEFICITDVRDDPRTAPAAAALEEKSARSFVNLPVVEQGRLVAVLFVNDDQVRHWSRPTWPSSARSARARAPRWSGPRAHSRCAPARRGCAKRMRRWKRKSNCARANCSTSKTAIGNGLLDHGMQVITKPFDIDVLAAEVRQMLWMP